MDGFDKCALTYDRHWCLETIRDQNDCAWLLVHQLRPKVTHLATPCSHMSVVGRRDLDPATKAQNAFTYAVASHQHAEGLGASIENPAGTLLLEEKGFIDVCGTMEWPKPGWSFYRSHGCQYALACPSEDGEPEPMQKSAVWVANFDVACMEMLCRRHLSLMPSVHLHRNA